MIRAGGMTEAVGQPIKQGKARVPIANVTGDRARQEALVLDLAGIIFSSVMMLMVIVRAVRLDRLQPWFQPPKAKQRPVAKPGREWRRRG